MNCPVCKEPNSKIIENRIYRNGTVRRRRRECTMCFARWTTYEVYKEDFNWLEKIEQAAMIFKEKTNPKLRKTAKEGASRL